MITRVGVDIGAHDGTSTLRFFVPADVRRGDLLVVLIASSAASLAGYVLPDSWVKYGEAENGAGTRAGAVWARFAEDDDAGAELEVDTDSSYSGGVLVAYRGASALGPLVVGMTNLRCDRSIGSTTHTTLATGTSQALDRRLLLWFVQNVGVTVTVGPSGSGVVALGDELDPEAGRVVAAEQFGIGPSATGGEVTITTSGTANGVMVSASLRMRPVPQPAGLVDPVPGTIGLVADP